MAANQPPNHPLFPRVTPGLAIDAVTNAVMAFGALATGANAGTDQARQLYLCQVQRNLDFRRNNFQAAHTDRLRNWVPSPQNQKQYLEAAMVQTMAPLATNASRQTAECTRCQNNPAAGGAQGPFETCRILPGTIPNVPGNRRWLNGACTNCHYHRQGHLCDFRDGVDPPPPKSKGPKGPRGPKVEDDSDDKGAGTGGGGKTQIKQENAGSQSVELRRSERIAAK